MPNAVTSAASVGNPNVGEPRLDVKANIAKFESMIRAGFAILVLILGHITPHPQLSPQGIPLNWLVVGVALLLIIKGFHPGLLTCCIMLFLLPLLSLAVTLDWSSNVGYGATKLVNVAAVAFLATTLMFQAARHLTMNGAFRVWILALASLLLATLIF